jgi:hypothetical protein
MSDQNPTNTATDTTSAPLKRIFKIGAARIAEDAATAKLSNEQVRVLLKSQYPEIANATIRETVSGETRLIEYIQQPGRKG